MLARQTQMQTIGSNVAKADQDGYHRQVAILTESYPVEQYDSQIGTGVRVAQVIRNFDAALENNLQNALEQEAYYEEYARYLQTIEQVMAHDGKSVMTDAVQMFADSLQDLSNDPESLTHRRALLSNAERVAQAFNQQYHTLVDVRDQIASSSTVGVLPEKVSDLNELATDLAEINNIIYTTELTYNGQQQAIDYRDQRDKIVKEMAKLADITVIEDANGFYDVTLGGRAFVSDTTVNDTVNFAIGAGPAPAVTWNSDNAAVTLNNGAIQGLVTSYNYAQARVAEITTYSNNFISQMNTLHTGGFDSAGTAGTNLFSGTAGTMAVAITNPDLVAASDNATNSGDGDNARAMWNGLNTPIVALGNDTLREHADNIVDAVALERNRTDALHQSSKANVEMFKKVIQEKTGVNVEEEMVHMLETQRAFQGAAKFISATDQLLQTVINLV